MKDAHDQKLVYVYFEDEPGRRAAAHLLTRDEARRIASNVVKLPELLSKPLSRGHRKSVARASCKPNVTDEEMIGLALL